MKSAIKILAGAGGLLFVVVALVFLGARFADGPIEILAGGPFRSGELHPGPEPDWSFLADRPTVEFQLEKPARSRTTFVMVHEGRLFIPSGYMTTWWGRIWKHWPYQAESNPNALLRVDGKLYERTLRRIQDGPDVAPVLAELGRKYGSGDPVPRDALDSGYLWLFELAPRE